MEDCVPWEGPHTGVGSKQSPDEEMGETKGHELITALIPCSMSGWRGEHTGKWDLS